MLVVLTCRFRSNMTENTAPTPGRAACEAFYEAAGGAGATVPDLAWRTTRDAWEAAVADLVRERDRYRKIAVDAVGTDPGVYGSSQSAIDRRAVVNHWREQLGMEAL
jgi:hypothetical protein